MHGSFYSPDMSSEFLPKHGLRVPLLSSSGPLSYSSHGDAFAYHGPIEGFEGSPSEWPFPSLPLQDISSFYSNLGTSDSSRLPYEPGCMPMTVSDENNYLTYNYDVFDVNSSIYAFSPFSSNPASPSMSTMSTSTEDSSQSPPPPNAELGYALDADFSTPVSNDLPLASHSYPQWLESPTPRHAQTLLPKHFTPHLCSTSPAPSPLRPDKSKSRSPRSRESSPNQSDSDQNNPRRRYPCLILGCMRRFTSQYTLKVHMEAHKPKPRVSFPCTLGCSEKFSRQHDRLRHEVAKHGKICEFSCEHCGRFFSTKKTLGNHKCPVAQGTRWADN